MNSPYIHLNNKLLKIIFFQMETLDNLIKIWGAFLIFQK